MTKLQKLLRIAISLILALEQLLAPTINRDAYPSSMTPSHRGRLLVYLDAPSLDHMIKNLISLTDLNI